MGTYRRWRKVVAYITRERDGKRQLLVFTHRDFPEAGVQVPAGTADEGESLEAALRREVEEETGFSGFTLLRELTVYDWRHPDTGNIHERHVFHLAAPEGLPEEWDWVETSGGAVPEHEGFVFQYRWIDLDAEVELAGGQGEHLHAIRM